MTLDEEDIDTIIRRITDALEHRIAKRVIDELEHLDRQRYTDTAGAAKRLHVSEDWIRTHATELRASRLDGDRGQLRRTTDPDGAVSLGGDPLQRAEALGGRVEIQAVFDEARADGRIASGEVVRALSDYAS